MIIIITVKVVYEREREKRTPNILRFWLSYNTWDKYASTETLQVCVQTLHKWDIVGEFLERCGLYSHRQVRGTLDMVKVQEEKHMPILKLGVMTICKFCVERYYWPFSVFNTCLYDCDSEHVVMHMHACVHCVYVHACISIKGRIVCLWIISWGLWNLHG